MFRLSIAFGVLVLASSAAAAAPPDLTGRWSGYWVSETDGHHGPLHAKFVPIDADTYRVRYHGRFAKIIPFVYTSKMQVTGGTDGIVLLHASRTLGPVLGTFETTAAATATSFDATFSSRSDAGRFVLSRRR